jgi:ABC-type antimicrobial peptide transport system permease subunit
MLKSYLKAAVRNLWRNRTISIINIIGLSIGFGLFLIIWATARYEKDFDKFHDNFEKIYQLRQDVYFENNSYKSARAGGGFASIIKDRYPSVDYSCRVSSPVEVMAGKSLPYGKQQFFTVNKLLAVDSSFFKIFSFKILKGKKPDPMEDPGAIVLTESLSKKIFGNRNPLNETLTINSKKSFIVTAIVEDPPIQSTIDFECIVNFNFMEFLDYNIDGLEGTMFFTYVLLGNPDKLEYINSDLQPYIESIHDAEIKREVYLQSFSRAHLYGEEFNYYGLYIYTTIGILILLIACINFINLTTAFSLSRTKEISIRKLTGASRRELIIQLMSETALNYKFSTACTCQLSY